MGLRYGGSSVQRLRDSSYAQFVFANWIIQNVLSLQKPLSLHCDSGRRKGNNFAAGDLKSHSDFPVDCYIIHCHIHVIFHKHLSLFTYFLTSLNIKCPSGLQRPD